jgi:hypothetical protein
VAGLRASPSYATVAGHPAPAQSTLKPRPRASTPFFTTNNADSNGYLLQGSYTLGKNRLALSYGKTEDDGNGVVGSGADYETRGIALFHDVNDNLKLVAE